MGHQGNVGKGGHWPQGAQGREVPCNSFGWDVATSWASAQGFEIRQGDLCDAAIGAGGVMSVDWAEGLRAFGCERRLENVPGGGEIVLGVSADQRQVLGKSDIACDYSSASIGGCNVAFGAVLCVAQ